jgi:putative lipoic acid-binding regulatory protein
MKMMDKKTEDFYSRLKEELSNSTLWPSEYLYKFILPSSNSGIAKIESEFNDMGAVITTQQSKTGKFTSVSISVTMPSAQSVIDKYSAVSDIEGIISL